MGEIFYEIGNTTIPWHYHIYIRIAILLFGMQIYATSPWNYMFNVMKVLQDRPQLPLTNAANENVSSALYNIEWSSQRIQSTMEDHFHSLKLSEIL